MQNKKLFVILGILVIVIGAAAFIGGRLLNGRVGPRGLGMPLGGNGGMVSVSVQVTPAPELPTTQPEVIGSFVERKDKTIVIQSVSINAGKGGMVLQTSGGGEGEAMAGSPMENDGPKVEVVINNDTMIYLETTQPPGAPLTSGETLVMQQTVEEGSLDDLTSQSFVTVWGRKSGDRIIAEVVFISNPVVFKYR
ncbi:MAG TPA: hypothetical protein VFC02_02385 [Anaerolineales bacterium]|nr:hypothetical protein [Anaerolineales bacterium]